ncbi:MAG: cytochrome b N-terminal domain-containing protein [Thermaerobacter sp.]|nr:cytochrome b N-terminal domain-containing protein [Thermaerobacter sp.]
MSAKKHQRQSFLDWLDERAGIKPFMNEMLYHRVPRIVNPLDFLGLATLFVFINQVVTGMFLAMFYEASSQTAYQSIQYIMTKVPLGWVVRDLHYWGANAMVVLVAAHMLRGFYVGAYKKPREITWITGVVLLFITILFAFTGYLLPWDQQSYWATMVGTWMPFYAPFVGIYIAYLARGGTYISGLTLTRFYSIHMLVLPALLLIFLGIHFAMVLKNQMLVVEEAEKKPKGTKGLVTFYPYTVFQMTMLIVVVAMTLLILALSSHAPLLAPADPLNKAHYNPVPLWFFFSIYQLLKYIPAVLDPLGIIGLPTVAVIVLLALPFFDKNPRHEPRHRPWAMSIAGVTVAAVVALTYIGAMNQGISQPGGGGGASQVATIAKPSFSADIEPIFQAHCAVCHSGSNASAGLDLTSYASIQKLGIAKAPYQQSILWQKLTGKMQPQMPLGGPYLPKTTIQTIANWITEGAPNN